MKMFDNRIAEKVFVTFSNSFKTSLGKKVFSEAVKNKFMEKSVCTFDLVTYKLTAKEVEAVYNVVKEKYV